MMATGIIFLFFLLLLPLIVLYAPPGTSLFVLFLFLLLVGAVLFVGVSSGPGIFSLF